MFRPLRLVVLTGVLVLAVASPAFACGGLVSPNGTVQLGRTTTLAAYHDGIEHYVTAFSFEGSGAKFGSIVPLPGIPEKVIHAGRWTLQRLELEVNPPQFDAVALAAGSAAAPTAAATVIFRTQIDALDVTVVKGGGEAVGLWARQQGFQLTPDAPEILDFYAARSPVFMAVTFDAERARARGIGQGDATPVHVVIPTSRPWVPLRILGLGASGIAPIKADVFLLTDDEPSLLPRPRGTEGFGPQAPGLVLRESEAAPTGLLADLGSDRGMKWVPESGMWLSYLKLDEKAQALTYDLGIDPTGEATPSYIDAGLFTPSDGTGFPIPRTTLAIPATNSRPNAQGPAVAPTAIDTPGFVLPWGVWLAIGLGAGLVWLAVAGFRERGS